ncbi:ferric iron uptake transcriptional regulator [Zhongshania aliphaticivorans]|uniref:ferric iron uptake transcriptional regulator n=1 Tax=Zhongshania aliphaticivorans TaxID=1470434 RepID=UPI0012E583BF|nr:ferric iron uptake transcriptional regulator [Zhongshania aliphaticivorans]CAA0119514.1 Ferric uptake regulation protein [Zhongshania aliphaticivorans]
MANESQELRDVGLKVTLPRIRILQILESSERDSHHLSAEDIYKIMHHSGDDTGLATIYRVLTQFEAAGLVVRHQFANQRSVFEIAKGDHHDHMVCQDSGEIIEFSDPMIERRQREIAEEHGYELIDHSLILHVRAK